MKLKLALLCTLGLASSNVMASCYTVYDRSNQVVYNAQTPPVDMSRPLHETMPAAFPGGHLVFDSGAACPGDSPVRRGAAASVRSPLLTDAGTAAAMGLPHTVMATGVALISNRPDSMQPGVVVAESGLPAAAPNTAAMGAGPATPARPRASNTVITEMYNPPLTAVQPGMGMPAMRAR